MLKPAISLTALVILLSAGVGLAESGAPLPCGLLEIGQADKRCKHSEGVKSCTVLNATVVEFQCNNGDGGQFLTGGPLPF